MKRRNSSGKYIAGLILLIALCVFGVFITTKGITKNKIGRASNIELGLDLAGGVSITYEVDGKNVSDSDMKDTVYKLQKRGRLQHRSRSLSGRKRSYQYRNPRSNRCKQDLR